MSEKEKQIDSSILKKHGIYEQWEKVIVTVGDTDIRGIKHSYSRVAAKSPLAIIGSRGFLEIAVNIGSARLFLKAERGDTVRVRLR